MMGDIFYRTMNVKEKIMRILEMQEKFSRKTQWKQLITGKVSNGELVMSGAMYMSKRERSKVRI